MEQEAFEGMVLFDHDGHQVSNAVV